MFAEPCLLIGDTINKLETISACFADEIDELQAQSAGKLPIEGCAAKEGLQTIKILIPKLRTAQECLQAVHKCRFVSM